MSVRDEIHWTVTATAAPDLQPLGGARSFDVLVVGGGLTGCQTALGLADAGVSVGLVDARNVDWGASGRSGGQCNPIWRKTPDSLKQILGQRHGENLIRTTLTAAETRKCSSIGKKSWTV